MPHCILEITKDLVGKTDTSQLMIEVSKAINTDRIFEGDDIKIRIYEINESLMGLSIQDPSYIAAEVIILDNKTEIQKQNILNAVQSVLISNFEEPDNKFSITSRLSLVYPGNYRRHVNY